MTTVHFGEGQRQMIKFPPSVRKHEDAREEAYQIMKALTGAITAPVSDDEFRSIAKSLNIELN